MNEVNQKKRLEKICTNAEWHKTVSQAEARKAAYLSKFEGRTMGEKYRLSQERVKALRAEKLNRN
jgi:hypothetical protein